MNSFKIFVQVSATCSQFVYIIFLIGNLELGIRNLKIPFCIYSNEVNESERDCYS
jgi:hypothetical protein